MFTSRGICRSRRLMTSSTPTRTTPTPTDAASFCCAKHLRLITFLALVLLSGATPS
jgi:hypothetical protein